MPAPYYYYQNPFAISADDLTTIPTNAAVDGSVSYFAGWTDPYEYNLLTNPAALPIPRGQMNQLFYDITNNLQEYQQYGNPQWIPGNIFPYPINAIVYYNGLVYRNLVASNTVTPGTDSSWQSLSQPFIDSANVQTFLTPGSGLYTPTPGMQVVIIRAQAGGGAGGSSAATSSTENAPASGAGAGEYIEALFTAAQIGSSKPFIVGAGGTPGSPGNNPGGNGISTTFNTNWITTNPGNGGSGSPASTRVGVVGTSVGGGTGGSVLIGTLLRQIPGGTGGVSFGLGNTGVSSYGGNSGAGCQGGSQQAGSSGLSGFLGSGGGGACSQGGTAASSGGAGGNGFLEFIELLST